MKILPQQFGRSVAIFCRVAGMNGRIADFKARLPDAAADRPELTAMVNELDVLTTTETFKFNRGDYA